METYTTSVCLREFLVRVSCGKHKVSSVSQIKYVKPVIEVTENKECNQAYLEYPQNSQEVFVKGLNPKINLRSMISQVIHPYFLIDLPYLIHIGVVYTTTESNILGILIPVQLNQNFQVCITFSDYFPRLTIPGPVLFEYPVLKIASTMTGSGVIIAQNTLITNAHIIKDSKSAKVQGVRNRARVLAKGKVLDLAILNCKLAVPPAVLAKKFIQGEKVFSVGFGLYLSEKPLITHGYLTKIISYNGTPLLGMISCQTFNGQSGGGVFNANNELIGIITANVEDLNDKVHEDLGFCILNTTFPTKATEYPYLWDFTHKEFAELFTFQTTKYLPYPKI